MKKIFLLLLLPLALIAQPKEQYYDAVFNSEFVSDLLVQNVDHQSIYRFNTVDVAIEQSILVDVPSKDSVKSQNLSNLTISPGKLPRHLITFSIIKSEEHQNPQHHLKKIIFDDDMILTKEDTLFPWLKTVNKKGLYPKRTSDTFQGFGPQILF